jgi:hypothetical protein
MVPKKLAKKTRNHGLALQSFARQRYTLRFIVSIRPHHRPPRTTREFTACGAVLRSATAPSELHSGEEQKQETTLQLAL